MVRRAVQLLREYSASLIAGVVIALAWANTDAAGYEAVKHWSPFGEDSHYDLHFFVNDIFMVLFFGIAAKEITESVLPGGALNPPRKAVNPLLATIGGVLGPIGVYFAWVAITGDDHIANGWGVPTATDIAIAWLVARMAFGPSHGAVNFLLLLAVADDGIGLGIIAVFYPDPNHPVEPAYLGMVAAAMLWAWSMRRFWRIYNFWPYLLGPGVASWLGLSLGHLHPALALVAIVPFIPSAERDPGLFIDVGAIQKRPDPLNAFEHTFKLPVDLGLFFFGLANAGVAVSNIGNATWAVLASLAIGKTVGIFGFSMLAHKLGFSLPTGMNARSLLVVGMIAGIGLTVALFVAGVAFTDPAAQGAAKMGALLSSTLAVVALLTARVLRVRRAGP